MYFFCNHGFACTFFDIFKLWSLVRKIWESIYFQISILIIISLTKLVQFTYDGNQLLNIFLLSIIEIRTFQKSTWFLNLLSNQSKIPTIYQFFRRSVISFLTYHLITKTLFNACLKLVILSNLNKYECWKKALKFIQILRLSNAISFSTKFYRFVVTWYTNSRFQVKANKVYIIYCCSQSQFPVVRNYSFYENIPYGNDVFQFPPSMLRA